MTRDYFKQALYNPYFQTDHYKNETVGGEAENKFFLLLRKINIFKKEKNDQNS